MSFNRDHFKMTPVSSKMIAEIGYSKNGEGIPQKRCVVVFKNGDVWIYKNMWFPDYLSFKSSPSVGAYFHKYIKNHYESEQVE